ncbi:type II secretion system F family protein [Weissella viridescens]|uniref:type II secretion system F family protein n=1 Tax=Weissella viridescens TaxID=1629 RepID=UPI003AF1F94C
MRFRRLWSRKRQAEFFNRLSHLLENGFDLQTALALIQRSCSKWSADIDVIVADLAQGKLLSVCLARFVNPSIIAELTLVELHGQQQRFLKILGDRERQHAQHVQKFWQLASYPICLFILILGMAGYFSVTLTQSSRLWTGLIHVGVMLTAAGLSLTACVYLNGLHVLMRLPYVGQIWRLRLQAQLCFQIGCLLQGGVQLTDVFEYLRTHHQLQQSKSGKLIHQAVTDALKQGLPLIGVLKCMPILPETVQTLFESGHPAKQVGIELQILAEDLNKLVERKIEVYLQLLQPLLFVILGGCIIALYGEFILPTYQNFEERF